METITSSSTPWRGRRPEGKGAVSLPAAGRYLNAPRVQNGLLAKNGLIQPFIPARAFGALDQYAVDDPGADFLKRLFAGAHPVDKPKPNQLNIPSAAGRCCCSSVEVLRLILDKTPAHGGVDHARTMLARKRRR